MKDELRVMISVVIHQPSQGGRLEVREEIELASRSFMELCAILAKFQELADRIKRGEP